MQILGFYIGGHDSNVALCSSDGRVKYYKLERIIQSKHKKGDLDWVKKVCVENEFIPDFVCFSDGNRNGLGICNEGAMWEECLPLSPFPKAKTYCIDHHYAHILSAFPIVSGNVDYGVCVDGRGDHQYKCSVIELPFSINECRMAYGNKEDAYCLMFNEIGKMMHLSGGELDFAGKIMGAHAYGTVDKEYLLELEDYAKEHGVKESLNLGFRGSDITDLCDAKSSTFYDWLATYHKWIEYRICELFGAHVDAGSVVVYSGGGAQNTVINNSLSKRFNVIIPPHCYDGGLSLGCIKFLALLLKKEIVLEHFPFCHSDEDLGYASDSTIEKVAELLSEGKIVGWCQGRSEIGPRALGHRSILMNPAIESAKDILNKRVKKREYWRPFAASVLRNDIEEIIGESIDLKYMLHAVQVLPGFAESLKGVIHVDGSCRLQTVDDVEELHSFYELITRFKQKTGVNAILNTSYNIAGMPIACSIEDVEAAFGQLDLDALCVGNRLMVRK